MGWRYLLIIGACVFLSHGGPDNWSFHSRVVDIQCVMATGVEGRDFYTQIPDDSCHAKATACKRCPCLLLSVSSPHMQRQKSFSQRMSCISPCQNFSVLYHLWILTQTNTRKHRIYLTVCQLGPLLHSFWKLDSIILQAFWLMSIGLKSYDQSQR